MLSQISKDEIRNIYLSLPVAAFMIDMDLNYVAANKKYADILGVELENLLDKNIHYDKNTQKCIDFEHVINLLANGKPIYDCVIVIHNLSYLVSMSPYYSADIGEFTAISVVLSDITSQKQHEQDLSAINKRLSVAYSDIKKIAHTDSLTGLMNRYGLRAAIEREFTKHAACPRNACVMVVDIDWFKSFNDNYGHAAGDDALVAVSAIIRSEAENSRGYAARFGGEEFVIFYPTLSPSEASVFSDSILERVRSLQIPNRSKVTCLTVSIGWAHGVTSFGNDNPTSTFGSLFHRADEALYQAKRSGRNRSCKSGVLSR